MKQVKFLPIPSNMPMTCPPKDIAVLEMRHEAILPPQLRVS